MTMSQWHRCGEAMFLSLAMMLAGCAATARAQDKPDGDKPEPKPPVTILRAYDIRVLLEDVKDHPLRTSAVVPAPQISDLHQFDTLGSAAGYSPRDPGAARQEKVDALSKLLMETVDPNSWHDNGGTVGTWRELRGQLLIQQTPENHKAVEAILNDLRGKVIRPVTISAHWILLSGEELDSVAPKRKEETMRVVDLIAAAKLPRAAVNRAGEITCLNGQTVHISSGRARTVVFDATPVAGNGVIGYSPSSCFLQDGLMLEIKPLITWDERVILDLYSVVSAWNDLHPSKPAPSTQPANAETPGLPDRIDMEVQQMRTTVTAPLDKAVIVGGMTATGKPGDAKDAGDQRLYLVIEVHSPAPARP